MTRTFVFTLAAAALFLAAPDRAAGQIVTMPAGWTQEFGDDEWAFKSPTDAKGSVNVLVPTAQDYEGEFEPAFREGASAVAQGVGGTIVRQGPLVYLHNRRELPAYVSFDMDGGPAGKLSIAVYGLSTRLMAGEPSPAQQMQIAFVIGPTAIKSAQAAADRRWQTAEKLVETYLQTVRLPMTTNLLSRIQAATAATTGGPTAPAQGSGATAAQQPQQQQPPPQPSQIIWSGRGTGNGLALVSPCSADGAEILAAVRRREYLPFISSLPALLLEEARATVEQWSGGGAAFTQVRQDGKAVTTTAEFTAGQVRYFGWFSITKRSDNFVQRGYVLAPAGLKGDQRVAAAVNAVRQMLAREDYGELAIEGSPPAPSQDSRLEAVFAFPRLAFALEGRPLERGAIEIALFKNGAATETGANLQGYWNRIPGGYSIEFSGGAGYVARVSDTCRSSATVASRPAPPARPAGAASTGCFGSPITIDFPRAVNVQKCGFIGGQYQCRLETEFRSNPATFTGCR